jgi:hypothetical protein
MLQTMLRVTFLQNKNTSAIFDHVLAPISYNWGKIKGYTEVVLVELCQLTTCRTIYTILRIFNVCSTSTFVQDGWYNTDVLMNYREK